MVQARRRKDEEEEKEKKSRFGTLIFVSMEFMYGAYMYGNPSLFKLCRKNCDTYDLPPTCDVGRGCHCSFYLYTITCSFTH